MLIFGGIFLLFSLIIYMGEEITTLGMTITICAAIAVIIGYILIKRGKSFNNNLIEEISNSYQNGQTDDLNLIYNLNNNYYLPIVDENGFKGLKEFIDQGNSFEAKRLKEFFEKNDTNPSASYHFGLLGTLYGMSKEKAVKSSNVQEMITNTYGQFVEVKDTVSLGHGGYKTENEKKYIGFVSYNNKEYLVDFGYMQKDNII